MLPEKDTRNWKNPTCHTAWEIYLLNYVFSVLFYMCYVFYVFKLCVLINIIFFFLDYMLSFNQKHSP